MENKCEMKSVIYEFDPVIYPTRFWVCKKPTVEDVSELFYPFNNDGEMVDSFGDVFEYDNGKYANTQILSSSGTRRAGCEVALCQSFSLENVALAYVLTRLCIT